jgi:hypothetical protein
MSADHPELISSFVPPVCPITTILFHFEYRVFFLIVCVFVFCMNDQYPIDWLWHTHMQHPATYASDSMKFANGHLLDHTVIMIVHSFLFLHCLINCERLIMSLIGFLGCCMEIAMA